MQALHNGDENRGKTTFGQIIVSNMLGCDDGMMKFETMDQNNVVTLFQILIALHCFEMANNDKGEVVSPNFDVEEVLRMSDVRIVLSEDSVEESMTEEVKAGPTPMGSLALRIGSAGEVDHVKWLVFATTGGHHWRVAAKKLFANAPKGAHVGGTVMMTRYVFYPGGWATNWQSAKGLGVAFFKKKTGSDLFTDEEVKEWGNQIFPSGCPSSWRGTWDGRRW
jgi:hypothetical protein